MKIHTNYNNIKIPLIKSDLDDKVNNHKNINLKGTDSDDNTTIVDKTAEKIKPKGKFENAIDSVMLLGVKGNVY